MLRLLPTNLGRSHGFTAWWPFSPGQLGLYHRSVAERKMKRVNIEWGNTGGSATDSLAFALRWGKPRKTSVRKPSGAHSSATSHCFKCGPFPPNNHFWEEALYFKWNVYNVEEDTVIQWNHCHSTWLPSISKQSYHLFSMHLNTRCNIAGVIVCTAAEMRLRRCYKSLIFTLFAWVLMWPQAKKFKGVRSGERAAQNHGDPGSPSGSLLKNSAHQSTFFYEYRGQFYKSIFN